MNRDLPESAHPDGCSCLSCREALDHHGRTGDWRRLPDSAFASPTIVRIATRTTERIAILERVRPVLSDAIQAARTEDEARLVTLLGVRIMTAVVNGGKP